MKPIPTEPGRVVLSKQGRDAGRYFIIIKQLENGFVLMADGDLRKIQRPKRKSEKHIKAKPIIISEIAHKINNNSILDSDIRKALAQVTDCEKGPEKQSETPTEDKEDCVLVQK